MELVKGALVAAATLATFFNAGSSPAALAAGTCDVNSDPNSPGYGYGYAGQESVPENYEGVARDITPSQGGFVVPDPQNQHVLGWMDANTYGTNDCPDQPGVCWTQVGIGRGNTGGQVKTQDAIYSESNNAYGYFIQYWGYAVATDNQFKVFTNHMRDGFGNYEWHGQVEVGSTWEDIVQAYQPYQSMAIEALAEVNTSPTAPSCPHINGTNERGTSFGASSTGNTGSPYALTNTFDGSQYSLWTGQITPVNSPHNVYHRTQIKANYAFKTNG